MKGERKTIGHPPKNEEAVTEFNCKCKDIETK